MATITNNVRWADNTQELKANLLQGIGTIDAMKSSVDRAAASMGGGGLFGAANKLVAAIDQLGGVTKLTAAEQDRANATLDKAIEKYKTMGMTAPPAMVALRESMQGTQEAGGGFTGWLQEMGDSFVARVAEGLLLRDAIREVINIAKEAVTEAAGLEDLSLATGISTDALQRMAYVGTEFGLSTDDMARGVERLSSKLANGDGNATKAVEMLGLSVNQLLSEGPQAAFLDIAEAVGRVEDPMARSGIASQLFGDRLAKVLLPALTDLRAKLADVPQDAIITDKNIQQAHDFDVKVEHLITTLKAYSIAALGFVNSHLAEPEMTDADRLNVMDFGQKTPIGGSDVELSPSTAATQKAINNTTLLQNRLKALQTEAMAPLSDAQKTQILELKSWGEGETDIAKLVGSNVVAVKLYIDAHTKAAEATKKTAAETTAWNKVLEDVNSAGTSWQQTLNSMDGGVVDVGVNLLKMGVPLKSVQEYFGLTNTQAKALDDQFKFLGSTISYASDSVNAHGVGVGLLTTRYSDLHNQITGVDDTTGLLAATALPDATGAFIDLGDGVVSGTKALNAFNSQAGTTLGTLDKSLSLLDASLRNIEQSASGSFGAIVGDFAQVVQSAKIATDSVKAFQKAQDDQDKAGMAIAAGGEAMQGIGQFESIKSGQTGSVAGMAQMTETGAALGTMIMPGIGTAIGAGVGFIAGALASVFRDQSVANVARDAGKDFGTTFSKNTSDAIIADMKNGMSEAASELNHLDSIIQDAGGITAKNVGQMTDRFHDLFSMLNTGQMTADQVNKQLQANFPALEAAATDATGHWSDGLKQVILLSQQANLNTQAINEALKTQGTNLGTSFNAVAAALVGDGGSLAGLSAQAVSTFASMVASGSSTSEALTAIGPGLESLEASYKALGLNIDDVGLKSLMMQSDIAKGNPQLMSGIQGLQGEFAALDNLGLMNTDQLSAMETQGFSMYTKLQAGVAALGGGTKDALLPMQGYLHEAQTAAEKLGVPLDNNTQMLIDQSKDAGIWQDAITPQDKLLNGIQTLVDKVGLLLDHLNNIPAKVTTTVTTDYQTTGTPPSADDPSNYAAHGGLVTNHGIQYLAGGGNVLSFTPRGSDTVPAMLTPGESVLTRQATATLGMGAIGALNRGARPSSASTGGGDVLEHTTVVMLDSNVLYRSTERVQTRKLQTRRKLSAA